MPKALLPKSTVLAYMVSISFLLCVISSFVAIIHSFDFTMSIRTPGNLPSSPVE